MKLIVQNDEIICFHEDYQEVEGIYPNAEVKWVPDSVDASWVSLDEEKLCTVPRKYSELQLTKKQLTLIKEKEKEDLICEEMRKVAVVSLQAKGVLDENENIIEKEDVKAI